MNNVKVNDTHCFALIGHTGDGKTSLGEAILHRAKATTSLGIVTEGTSHLSTLPEEKERQSTLTSSVFGFEWSGKHITLVDTPGDSNFQADGRIALCALDGAILLVSAASGPKVGTQRMWQFCRSQEIPVLAFINAMDKERSDFPAMIEALKQMGANPVAVTLPMGHGDDFSGVVDLLKMSAVTASGDAEIPSEFADAAADARAQLVEAVAECDDSLLEKYLEEGALTDAEVAQGLVIATRSRQLTPVFCGAALSEVGIETLMQGAVQLLPSAADRDPWKDANGDPVAADPDAPFAAVVFKTVIDRYAGALSVFRVVSGTAHSDSNVLNTTREQRERFGKLQLLRGIEHVEVDAAGPGDIVAVAKLKDTHTGDVLTAEKGAPTLREIPIPQGVISYAISAKSKGDEDKVYASLGRLVEEDPTLQLGREASTGEFLLTGMGELHVRITMQKLQRLFGVEVELKKPKVPYRETITRRAENVEGKLKKQTGGKGMFGVCYLTIEPKPRGEGIEFVDEIKGGAIPRSLIPAVEKGIYSACEAGPLAGYPVVDVRVHCIDGKHHAVDSNEMAFKLAGSFGLKAAVQKAKPVLLEPVMDVEVSIPGAYVGDIMGDLSSRRGRVQSSEAKGSTQVIQAQVPMSEMLEYASQLTSMTGGQGEFHMEFSHYDEAPSHVREKVVAEAGTAAAESA
ncbi:MAG: elongation factor G [Deltaproteobacteria bacterium]|jgi:elongation factor G|nr:elongation factor G [Deltaproteobacteria bacterium]